MSNVQCCERYKFILCGGAVNKIFAVLILGGAFLCFVLMFAVGKDCISGYKETNGQGPCYNSFKSDCQDEDCGTGSICTCHDKVAVIGKKSLPWFILFIILGIGSLIQCCMACCCGNCCDIDNKIMAQRGGAGMGGAPMQNTAAPPPQYA